MSSTFVASALRFGRHALEMCIVMCPSTIALNVLAWGFAAVAFGYTKHPRVGVPQLAVVVLAVTAAIPMIVWMRWRKHEWRPTVEMAASPGVVAVAALAANAGGFLASAELFELVAGLACPAMIVAMLFRLDLYAGTGHVQHAPHAH